jgi:hypothetical protein
MDVDYEFEMMWKEMLVAIPAFVGRCRENREMVSISGLRTENRIHDLSKMPSMNAVRFGTVCTVHCNLP